MQKVFPVFFSLFLFAQAAAEGETSGYWAGIFPHYRIDESQRLSFQGEFRRLGPNSIGLFRPAYHWVFHRALIIGLGYDFIAQNQPEQRVWPELSGHTPIGYRSWVFDWRLRHEIRFFEGKTRTGERTRLMVGLHMDLSKANDLSLYLFDEAFWNFHDASAKIEQWERNRVGARLRMGPSTLYYDVGTFYESLFASDRSGLVATLSVGGVL